MPVCASAVVQLLQGILGQKKVLAGGGWPGLSRGTKGWLNQCVLAQPRLGKQGGRKLLRGLLRREIPAEAAGGGRMLPRARRAPSLLTAVCDALSKAACYKGLF